MCDVVLRRRIEMQPAPACSAPRPMRGLVISTRPLGLAGVPRGCVLQSVAYCNVVRFQHDRAYTDDATCNPLGCNTLQPCPLPLPLCLVGWLKTVEGYYKDQVQYILTTVTEALARDSRRRFIWCVLPSRHLTQPPPSRPHVVPIATHPQSRCSRACTSTLR